MKQWPALDLRYSPSTTGDGLLARFTVPNSNGVALDGIFAAKGTDVTGVLGDLHLLYLLSEGGAISVGKRVNIGNFVRALLIDSCNV
jgi:hypothetical protein